MKTLKIKTSVKEYDIKLGFDILKNAGALIADLDLAGNIFIITDQTVADFHLNTLKNSLLESGFSSFEIIIKPGERHKNIETVNYIYNKLAKLNFKRNDIIIAFGGGVVGDIAGFAAATFLRGVKFIQIPTTLLAQVDSSIGGKTGVDLSAGKNLVGAFWQPELVIADTALLNTLPKPQIASGMAEIIKAGFIRDSILAELLENSVDFKGDLEEFILRAITVKKEIVQADEFEQNERMLLNFGHTFAHSIEKYYNYENITHGEAVAIGMCLITKNDSILKRLYKILSKYNLPVKTDISMDILIENAKSDKKCRGDKINIVVVNKVGEGEIKKIDFAKLRRVYG